MADPHENANAADLIRRVEQAIREEREQRPPLGLAYLTVIAAGVLCLLTLWFEWHNISLALNELFPPLSDGTSYADITGTLAFASVIVILLGDAILAMASNQWSPGTWQLMFRLGILSLALFALGAMAMLPLSILQANDVSEAAKPDGSMSYAANFAFGVAAAAMVPLAIFGNFVLFIVAKPALAKIEAAKQVDQRSQHTRERLTARDAKLAALREVDQRVSQAPSDADVAERHAARVSAVIGQVASELHGIILARRTAERGSEEKPLLATDDAFLNHTPIEELEARRDYLSTFTPAFVRQLLTKKEATA